MSSGVDTRPVPVSLLRWPRTRDLVTQYKGILMYLWAHPEQTACGCYLFPLDATAADLSMSSPSLADAMSEFQRRKLIDLDQVTGEIMLPDWFRWYKPRTPAACGAVESSIKKILSIDLRGKVEKAYRSIAPSWKGKEKEKGKEAAAPRAEARAPADAAAAALPGGKRRGVRTSGIVTWDGTDAANAEQIEQQYDATTIAAAVAALKAAGKQPVPGLVELELERSAVKREQAEKERQQRDREQAAAVAGEQRMVKWNAQADSFLQSLDEAAHAALLAEFGEWLTMHNKATFQFYRRDGLQPKSVQIEFRKYIHSHHLTQPEAAA
ncbi:MAG: hypothetical protein HZB40_01565 [Rhodocyclales bacterium]|nr:hypothetical protein [Rhodocyclales bacterium]